MAPDWMEDIRPGQETITAVAGAGRVGRFVDYGAVHIVTTGARIIRPLRSGGVV